MAQYSAGILLYRFENAKLEVLLAHPGGPFWAKKDNGAWSIPKGLLEENEDVLAAAKREFREETGFAIDGEFLTLGDVAQSSRKTVSVFAIERDVDAASAVSNTFELEWPPRSGKISRYPEIDRIKWFAISDAREKILKGQRDFLARLAEQIGYAAENENVGEQQTLF